MSFSEQYTEIIVKNGTFCPAVTVGGTMMRGGGKGGKCSKGRICFFKMKKINITKLNVICYNLAKHYASHIKKMEFSTDNLHKNDIEVFNPRLFDEGFEPMRRI